MATLLVKVSNTNMGTNSQFHFCPPLLDSMTKGINVASKDILYNFIGLMIMSKSSSGKPFRAAKKIDPRMM
jgi:hypothetical protein